jgi:ATP adenylyltransferase
MMRMLRDFCWTLEKRDTPGRAPGIEEAAREKEKGAKARMWTRGCDFCHEFSGETENSFHRIYRGNPESRLLFQSAEFVVIPSLGQITEGYLLLLPRQHFLSTADLPTAGLNELATISRCAGEVLKEKYGPYIVFEHGIRSEDAGGCGIYHAHLHATPLDGASDPIDTLKLRFPYMELEGLHQIKKETAGLPCYLLYQDSAARLYLFKTGPLPSQYMRKLLADSIGQREWNWRTSGRERRLVATLERLTGQFNVVHEPARHE